MVSNIGVIGWVEPCWNVRGGSVPKPFGIVHNRSTIVSPKSRLALNSRWAATFCIIRTNFNHTARYVLANKLQNTHDCLCPCWVFIATGSIQHTYFCSPRREQWGNVFDRHNFGYLLKRKSEIYVATYQARLIFHLNLPDWRVAFRDLDYDCRVRHNVSIRAACSQLRYVLNAVKKARKHVQTHVRDQLRRNYEVIEDIPVRARGRARRGFLTDSLGKITGLATKDELHHVNHFLEEIEKAIYATAKFWGERTNSLVAVFKLEQDRLNNAFEILGEFRATIQDPFTQLCNWLDYRD